MSDLKNIEADIAHAEKAIDLATKLEKLKSNKEFKTIILDQYLQEYAANLVHSKALPENQDDKSQRYIDGQMLAIGHLVRFFNMTATQGVTAKEVIDSCEEERALLLAGGEFN